MAEEAGTLVATYKMLDVVDCGSARVNAEAESVASLLPPLFMRKTSTVNIN